MDSFDPGLRKVAVALLEHLDTPRSLAVKLLLDNREWVQLVNLRCDPAHYLDACTGAEMFRRDYQATEFLRKSPLIPRSAGINPVRAAKETFEECEEQCLKTNLYLDLLDERRGFTDYSALDARMHDILSTARKLLGRWLGKVPDVESLDIRFGPGTCYELKGSPSTTVADKITSSVTTTPSAAEYFWRMLEPSFWQFERASGGLPHPDYTSRGNRFSTVPKTADKARGICIEPLGNLVVQLAIGGYLKRRLAAVGLHVGTNKPTLKENYRDTPFKVSQPFDGQHYHKLMAREGSRVGGKWATIDLSNASDTIAKGLVSRVFPAGWATMLSAIRSPRTLLNGKWRVLEKFSSMGNGTTFEMETALFAAILSAGCNLRVGHELFVYGDDILLPHEHFRDALAVLKAFGFTPNARKSYGTGPFRESCGGDFFEGFDVRPCYADSDLSEPTDWMVLHNQIRARWGSNPALQRCVQQTPIRFRLFGPTSLGDRVFHGAPRKVTTEHGIRYVAVLTPIPTRVSLSRWGSCHLSAILSGGVTGVSRVRRDASQQSVTRGWLTPRGAPSGYLIRQASIS